MKDIQGYEGLYAITEDGKVWSYKSNRFLKPYKNSGGYLRVALTKDWVKKQFTVHRLVAEAYIPNPENKPQVNHKDENKENNNVDNLEWMTAKENNNYGTRTQRATETFKSGNAIYCEELDKVFNGYHEAARELNTTVQSIVAVCRGNQLTVSGYHLRKGGKN